MDKPYLSEVIDYERDIEPYGFIEIYSGVGSGKNYFVNQLVSGYTSKRADGSTYEVSPKSVLLITSRRAKVDELVSDKELKLGSYILEWESPHLIEDIDLYLLKRRELPDLDGFGAHSIHQRSIACTNAAIEKFLQKHYLPDDATTHLWHRFDFIIFDEAHSVLADASYQSAPFYVHQLVNKAIKEHANGSSQCKVIVMTGTPSIISSFSLPLNGHAINLMDVCRSVVPKQVVFVDSDFAQKDLLHRLEQGERAIYFCNHIKDIFKLYSSLPESLQAITALSFSKQERLDVSDPRQKALLDLMKNVEATLAEEQKLPDDINLLLTTSKNKEGINIGNNDIKTMYVEAHTEIDVIQMAGRVREGLDTLYVIKDSSGFGSTYSELDYIFSKQRIFLHHFENLPPDCPPLQMSQISYINEFFEAFCRKHKIDLKTDPFRKATYSYEELKQFIDFVHEKFPYVRFNYFTDSFAPYTDRRRSIEYFEAQNNRFAGVKDDPEGLADLARSWFKGINSDYKKSKLELIEPYLTENNLIGVPYDKQKKAEIAKAFSAILKKPVANLNPVLTLCGYKEVRCSQNRNASTFGMHKIVKC